MSTEKLPPSLRDALIFSASCAGGPGGQNVNKVASAIMLLVPWDALEAHLTAGALQRLRTNKSHWCSREGLRIHARTSRSQTHNRELAITRLIEALSEARKRPKIRKAPKGPSPAAKRRRLDSKSRASQRKRLRGRVRGDE